MALAAPDKERKLRELLDAVNHNHGIVELMLKEFESCNIILGQLSAYDVSRCARIPAEQLSGAGRFAPLSDAFWDLLCLCASIILQEGLSCTWLGEKPARVLWLALYWAPSRAATSIVTLLASASTVSLDELARFGALVLGHESVPHTVSIVLAACDSTLPEHVRSTLSALAGPLVREADLVEGESGGFNKELVLERLQFHARVMRYRLGMEGMWMVGPSRLVSPHDTHPVQCEPCIFPELLPSFSKEDQVIIRVSSHVRYGLTCHRRCG